MRTHILFVKVSLYSILFGLLLSCFQSVNALASDTYKSSLNQRSIKTTGKRELISQANQTSYQTNYARSISDVRDARPTDWAYTALQSAIERYGGGVVRLYSDGSFAGNEYATRAEMIDSMGGLLDVLFTIAKECKIERPNFPFTPSVNSDQFYYRSYEVIARATGVSNLLYSQGGSDRNANQILTRADAAVIIRRYFAQPLIAMGKASNSKSLYKSITNYLDYQSKTPIAQITSVNQISDIRPDDPFYEDIKFMVEMWGSLATYPDGTFRPRQSISRYELIAQLNAAADKGGELIAAVCANKQSSVESNKVTIVNNTNIDIFYSLNGKDYRLSSGQIEVHKGEDFNVEFDSSLTSGYQRVSYRLKPDSVNRFRKNGDQIDLLYD